MCIRDRHEIDRKAAPIPAKQVKLFGNSDDPRFRAMLAIEALKDDEPIAQLAKNNNVETKDIREWRAQLVSNAAKLFQ